MMRKPRFLLRLLLPGAFLMLINCSSKDQPEPPQPPPAGSGTVRVWLTKGDKSKLLNREGDLTMKSQNPNAYPLLVVDTSVTYQTIDGFGAALTGSSAYLFNRSLSAGARQTVFRKLFDTVNGAGISYMRLTIGASDFCPPYFTYDDMPAGQEDFQLQHFSLSRDTLDVIPMLKEILALSPKITLLGSPWSPPAWMKNGGSLIGGSLRSDCHDVYAGYFVRYIQAMAAKGITIRAVTPQNEPLYAAASYPCMSMPAADQAAFIRNSLGPALESAGLATGIIAYDHNWDHPEYPIAVLNDAGATKYVIGSAFHGYGGDVSAMSSVHAAHPEKELYFTEISGGTWATNFSDNLMWNMRNIFIGSTANWSRCALLWNLALDEKGGPHENNTSTCRGVVTVNSAGGQVTYNEEYYAIAHFSKFVRPGSVRVKTILEGSLSSLGAVAFRVPGGSKALVVSNYGSAMQVFTVQQGEKFFSYTIPGYSVATLTW